MSYGYSIKVYVDDNEVVEQSPGDSSVLFILRKLLRKAVGNKISFYLWKGNLYR